MKPICSYYFKFAAVSTTTRTQNDHLRMVILFLGFLLCIDKLIQEDDLAYAFLTLESI